MKTPLHLLVFLLAIILANQTSAQTAKIDSLENVLQQHKTEDTVKVNLLNEIAFEIYDIYDQKARDYATEAGKISDSLNFKRGKGESMRLIGLSYFKSDKPKALRLEQEALKYAEEINDRPGIVRCLYNIGFIHRKMGQDSISLVYMQKVIQFADSLNDKLMFGLANFNIASINYSQGNNDLAIEGFLNSIQNFTQINEKKYKSLSFNSLGVLYVTSGNYPKAIECFHKSLTDFEALKDTAWIFNTYNALGNVYSNNSKMDESFEYYTQALRMAEALNDKTRITMCLNNIGIYYFKTNNPLAKEYFQKVLANCETIQQPLIQQGVLQRMGNIYEKEGDLEQAKSYYQNALKIIGEKGLKAYFSSATYYLGRIYLKQHQYSEALSLSLKGLEEAKRFNIVVAQKDLNEQLAEIYSAKGDFKKAYFHYKQFKTLNDSLYNESNIKKITELDYTYKFEKEKQALELEQQKKDAIQLAEIKQQRIILCSLTVGILLLVLLVVYIYRANRQKHKDNVLLTQQKREIEQKNEELVLLNEEIQAQKEEITSISNEIEKQNSRLLDLNATKDKFFGIIAHDLKNPFNAILGFSNILVTQGNMVDSEKTMKYISLMHTSAKNAYKLLENLLEWSRSQTGAIDFNPQKLNLKYLAVETEKLCENQANEKQITLGHQIPENITIHADQNMLSTVLRNLITNAIKFTHKGGSINVTSTQLPTEVVISVADNGIGMDDATRNKLFKISEKITIAGTEQEKGTGLGLLLCKEFVEKHGGRIWVESEMGKGSTFRFSIPSKV